MIPAKIIYDLPDEDPADQGEVTECGFVAWIVIACFLSLFWGIVGVAIGLAL